MRIIGIHNVSLSESPLRLFSPILLFRQTAKVFLKLAHLLFIGLPMFTAFTLQIILTVMQIKHYACISIHPLI